MKICPRCSELFPDESARCPRDDASLELVLDQLLGRTVGGRYRLISRLGSGGMSSVYLARHVMIDRLMAIKTLRRDLARDPLQRDRFIREARAVNRINHENIVEITDFGETEDGLVYLVMEYVPGTQLLEVLAQGPMPSARALRIVEQCASALARAHEMGVVHRDLKPENLLLVPRREHPDFVKVLDFGIAKILDAPSLTGSQQIFGTPGYIAPEYIQSTNIDGRADLYSLGVILYEMVTGDLPFDYEYPGDLLVKHVTEQPIPPRERLPSVEPAMEELILRCLRKDPAERFRDAFHMIEEIERVRELIGSPGSWGGLSEPSGPEEDGWGDEREVDGSHARKTIIDGTPIDGAPGAVPREEAVTPLEASMEVSEDDVEASGTRLSVTAEYAGLSIPEPPAYAEAVPFNLIPKSKTPEPPRRLDPERDGICGVKRWRSRFDALRACVVELERDSPAPLEIARGLAFASRTLDELEVAVADAEVRQDRIEALESLARDFRSTFGKAIDGIASKLSGARAELGEIVTRRQAIRDKKDAVRQRVRAGEATEGDADALLWELAALEEEVGTRANKADELESRLTELRAELEQENEIVERENARTVQWLDGQMMQVEAMARALREPLDRVEAHVLARWPIVHPASKTDEGRLTPTSG